ncbi:response regulator [Cesiribacter sp. SM1]|uniref:response regulator n=1 Tax=Cesiribacter sp. SM1 TaxID=2861196 RepID=UPI001CD2E3E0|nr:response regulator [Cesiribacter sp. SM1]
MKKIKCILLIDDDETTNIINEMLIMDMGVTSELLQARNGKEGIELLQKKADQNNLPELILLDINMPVMDGFAFLEAYQKMDLPDKDSVIIIMLTTSLNPSDVERARSAGVADYISKPLTEKSLQSILEKHVRNNSTQ